MMGLHDVDRLLDPSPLSVEMGFERFDDGVLHVAVHQHMSQCTGEMIEWWFRFRPNTQQYIWWHPVDHVSSAWAEGVDGTHIGSIHQLRECCSGFPQQDLSIQFRDPLEYFDRTSYEAARAEGALSAAVCGQVGLTHLPARADDGRILGSTLLHIGRDTAGGCTLRSHFYLGQDYPALGFTPAQLAEVVTDDYGRAVLMHSYNEFAFLSGFLPSLYSAENRGSRAVSLPW